MSRGLQTFLGDWQRLLTPIEENQADLVHLEVPRARLQELLERSVAIHQEQASRRAAKQEASRQLQAMAPEAQRLATLLRMALKAHYGIRSEKLAEFGILPFRGRPRKAKAGAERPAPGPSPGSTATVADRPLPRPRPETTEDDEMNG